MCILLMVRRNLLTPLPPSSHTPASRSLNWVNFALRPGAPPAVLAPVRGADLGSAAYIQDVTYGATVDIAFVNPSPMTHPMHIHGHSLWLLGIGNGNILKSDGSIDYSELASQPGGAYMERDTVPVPNAVMRGGAPGAMPSMPAAAVSKTVNGMSTAAAKQQPASQQVGGSMTSMSGARPAAGAAPMAAGAADASSAGGMASMGGVHRRRLRGSDPGNSMAGMAMSSTGAQGGPPAAGPSAAAAPETDGGQLVPGYAVVRFVARNAGVWPFHCHIDSHAEAGMFMALRIARPGATPWTLPSGFKECQS